MNRQFISGSLKYIAGVALAALLLWWVFRQADSAAILGALESTWPLGLALSSLFMLAQVPFRVWRWRALLEPVKKGVGFQNMMQAVIFGYAANIVVPGRLGEILRPMFLAGRERLPAAACLGSILADRWLDGVAVLALFLIGLIGTTAGADAAHYLARLTGASILALLILCVPVILALGLSFYRPSLERRLSERNAALRWAGNLLLSFSRGTEAIRTPRLWSVIVVHSLLVWLAIGLGKWAGLRACGVDISLAQVFVLLPILVLGVAIPTPGGAGGYHAGMTLGLVYLFDVDRAQAVGAGIVVHLAAFVPMLSLAALLLIAGSVTLQDLSGVVRSANGGGETSNLTGAERKAPELRNDDE